jgi:hypothetical protein
MEPCLENYDKLMFYKYLDKANVYFEFGSGGSTYQALIRNNIKKVYSVESDLEWYTKVKSVTNINSKLNMVYIDIKSVSNTWGNPGPDSSCLDWKNYSDQINVLLDEKTKEELDFVMIDGRFRVACCLKCFNVVNDNCFIAFDDFLNRPYYHVVFEYFDFVERTDNNRMVILRKKKNIEKVSEELIKKYELIKE